MIIIIREKEFDVEEDGTIKRKLMSGRWKEIINKSNHNKGYNVILINKKQYMRSSIIAHAFLNYDLDKKIEMIRHLDSNRLNCNVENLGVIRKKNA